MKVTWTEEGLERLSSIQSQYFTSLETITYKKRLLLNIEEKILLLGKSIPAREQGWEGSYKIIVDKFIVYYAFSANQDTCYIEYFKHSRQQS
ncbi:type II toxin-antitoxin system RelE/ParE family toxin [Metabacillus herbersteinensis]|uniref:Type II toxin-antitoxin system RelE/ParE family toxin n=1 Tax=Metabacillus herbersteinensis TaxID=283816 RepID=A0ABV6GHL5_9BACI